MNDIKFQHTLSYPAHVSGRGYWSGRAVTLTILPALPNAGILFRRVDLPGRPEIPALADYRSEANLRTKLVRDTAHVEMIEHVMAALHGMEIDNCIVECDAPEMPAMDGSALAIAIAIENAGRQLQPFPVREFVVRESIRLGTDDEWVQAIPSPESGLHLQYQLDYGPKSPIPSSTSTYGVERDVFFRYLAPARTFVTQSEAEQLQSAGVALHVTYRDLIVFGDRGPIDNSLRFTDECSRHKLLDLVGDIALSGVRIRGSIIAHRSGHILNGRLAHALRQQLPEEWNQATHSDRPAPTRHQRAA